MGGRAARHGAQASGAERHKRQHDAQEDHEDDRNHDQPTEPIERQLGRQHVPRVVAGLAVAVADVSRRAIVIARAASTPRILDRDGEDLWSDPDVVAVNKFHNAMVGQDEYVSWSGNSIMMIERGTFGMVIVNLGGGSHINEPTRLADGSYANKATASCTLQVSGGRISGYIPEKGIVPPSLPSAGASSANGEDVAHSPRASADDPDGDWADY